MQKEFAGTIKICELGLLCAVTPKAAKALKGTLKTQAAKLPAVPNPTRVTGLLPAPKMVKHHLFNVFRGNNPETQKYRDFFKFHGINVHDYCVEIPATMHRNYIHAAKKDWTSKWKIWIDTHPEATIKDIYQFNGTLMDEYGLSHLPIVRYK